MAPRLRRAAAARARRASTLQDFDFYEIHEAFAVAGAATLAAWEDADFCREGSGRRPLGAIDRAKLNVNGSSLAAGHPFAATGGRIVATLAKLLAEKGSGRGARSRSAPPAARAWSRSSSADGLRPLAHPRPPRPGRAHAPLRRGGRPAGRPRTTTARRSSPGRCSRRPRGEGFYNPLFYRDLIGDPTGLSLPLFMEELFWGCAGIGLAIVMPALALSAMAQAATPEQLLRWAPRVLRRAGRPQARRAVRVRARRAAATSRNLRTTRPPRRRRVGHRRPQDLDRQRRHRERARRQRDGRPRARAPRPGAVRRPRRDARACELVRKLDKLGCRASHTAELRFEGVRVPADHLLGGDDAARAPREAPRRRRRSSTLGAFEQTRPMVAAQALGIARAALEFAIDLRDRARGVRRPDHRASRASRSRSPTSPPTSTPPGC